MAFRDAAYGWWGKIPVQIISGVGWLVGFASAVRPNDLKKAAGSAVTAEMVQQIGIWLLAAASVYFFVLWVLKPSLGPTSAGMTLHIHNNYPTLPELLAQSGVVPQPPMVEPNLQSLPPISGKLEVTEENDTFNAEGTTGLNGLYIGYIIVAAGELENARRLDFAIVGYNGSTDTIRVADVVGRIRAGTGNLRDHVKLPTPLFQGVLNGEPGKEFVLQMRQDVSGEQAEEYLVALGEEKSVSLDLRELNIIVSSVSNHEKRARLPLWDGVNLRRRDDIVSNRNTIMGLQATAEVKASLGMVIARVDGTTEKRDV